MKMKYKYSNTEIVHHVNGKEYQYKICDVCCKEEKSNYGVKISYDMRGACGYGSFGLCGKCAKKYIHKFQDAISDILKDIDKKEEE